MDSFEFQKYLTINLFKWIENDGIFNCVLVTDELDGVKYDISFLTVRECNSTKKYGEIKFPIKKDEELFSLNVKKQSDRWWDRWFCSPISPQNGIIEIFKKPSYKDVFFIGDVIAKINSNISIEQFEEEFERECIAKKIKEKYRKRQLEKIIRQELIDSGELFGEQPKRPPIPREIVDAVYKRDGGRCVYCGSTQNLQLDHIIPFSKGGATTLENMQLLCQKCNIEKSNKIG